MIQSEQLSLLHREFAGSCREILLSDHTTWQIGGPAIQLRATSSGMLGRMVAFLRDREIPWFVLGMGSNVLAPSEGTEMVIVSLSGELTATSFERDGDSWRVHAGGGARLPSLAGAACMQGAGGLQFAVGIPGTLGGAVVMNAGAYGTEIADLLRSVTVRHPSGRREVLAAVDCGFGYRSSRFQGEAVVVESAEMCLKAEDPTGLRREAADVLALRRRKFPLDFPNAGSVFRRPDEGPPPGQLIEESGLKGFRVGGAEVSTLHANFVVNKGDASSADITEVIDVMRKKVLADSGISLREEVLYMPRTGEGS